MRKYQFDSQPVEEADLLDLDKVSIDKYLRRRTSQHNEPFPDTPSSKISVLMDLGILTRSKDQIKPTVGGVLLFGKNTQRFLRSSKVKVVKFKGRDTSGLMIDRKDLTGTVPELIEKSNNFLVNNMRFESKISGLHRIDMPEYPLVALREAVTNAIVHRDYEDPASSIRIFIYDDRIEVYTPGSLPGPVTIENIEYTQYSRNEVVVNNIIYLGKYMEGLGTGINRIKAIMKEGKLKEPKLVDTDADFLIILYGTGSLTKYTRTQNFQKYQSNMKKNIFNSQSYSVAKPFKPKKKLKAKITRLVGLCLLLVFTGGFAYFCSPLAKSKRIHLDQFWMKFYPKCSSLCGNLEKSIKNRYERFVGMYEKSKGLKFHYKVASNHHTNKEYEKAIDKYQYIISKYSDDPKVIDALYYLASCFDILKKEKQAIETYNKVIFLKPSSNKANLSKYWIGKIYFRNGKINRAILLFQEILHSSPDDLLLIDIHSDLAKCFEAKHLYERSIKLLKKVLLLKNNMSDGFENYHIALSYKALGKYNRALKILNLMIDNPLTSAAWISEAEMQLKEIKNLNDKTKVSMEIVDNYINNGKYEAAFKKLKTLLMAAPYNKTFISKLNDLKNKSSKIKK